MPMGFGGDVGVFDHDDNAFVMKDGVVYRR